MAIYSTNSLKKYLDKIFGAFEKQGCKVGQGGFFTRNWYNDRTLTYGFRQHLCDVLNVLQQNGHIIADNSKSALPFLRLSQSGYDYMEGGDLPINELSLCQLINIKESKEKIYEHLWAFIGKVDEAPFYLNGSDFFNTIAPYVGLTSYTYSQYTKKRIEDGKSASRTEWYRELFYQLPSESVGTFLNDISLVIKKIYTPLLKAKTEDDVDKLFFTEESNHSTSEDCLECAPQQLSIEKKLVIFITYTWETKITPGHKAWVKKLADRLRTEGFEVLLDQYQPFGTEMNYFMADSVIRADRILLICTPTFKQRSNDLQNACGFEASMISNELIKNVKNTKFLPIVRIGEPAKVMPTYLGNRNALIWHEEDKEEDKLKLLVDDLRKA